MVLQKVLKMNPANNPLKGDIEIPPDKSISHRAVIFGSICDGNVKINNFSSSSDCKSSLEIIKNLGIETTTISNTELIIHGKGLNGYKNPSNTLDAGNSGTTIRMMTGLLAGHHFDCTITGDESLQKRPMARVIKPLLEMNASISATGNNTKAPINIKGSTVKSLKGITYNSPVASAQVKSCILLAGLYAKGDTSITEPFKSRDHTERLFEYLGAKIERTNNSVMLKEGSTLYGKEITIPGDISSAAFFMVAASIIEDSEVTLTNVGINPTRTGVISGLQSMGANINIINKRILSGEPVADIIIKYAKLKATEISGEIIPKLIDEIPILAVAACFAEGKTIIKDAEELRHKESDRLKAIYQELTKIGAIIEETPDGLIIQGSKTLKGGCSCDSHLDHRIAMSIAIASLACEQTVIIERSDWIKISFPEFITCLDKLRR